MADEISNAQQKGTIDGVLLNREDDSVEVNLGNYILTVKHDYTLGWSPRSKENDWPFAGGFIIAIADDEFYVAGTGLVITFKPKIGEGQAGILRVEEGAFDNGKWKPGRRLNGDEDHQGRHLRISVDQYDIQKIKLYQYK